MFRAIVKYSFFTSAIRGGARGFVSNNRLIQKEKKSVKNLN
jgi:ABC-type polysaccharide/polyol phosphate export permease